MARIQDAKRGSGELFIGAMTDTITKNLDIDLSFIEKGDFELEAF